MTRLLPALLMTLLFALPCFADTSANQAEHDALRKLKTDISAAVNSRDYAALQQHLHQPFMATVITQNSFNDFGKLKDYFDNLYARDTLRIKNFSIAADADELSQIYQGTFALTRGSTKEHYEMADGRSFDMDGRWTAVSLKENGEWKVLSVHTGTNFLDNPVLNAVEKSVIWFGLGGLAIGLFAGFLSGRFFKRK